MSKDLLDKETLKDQDKLTDEQLEAIKKNAYKEVNDPDKDDELDDDDPFKDPPIEKSGDDHDKPQETDEEKKEREEREEAERLAQEKEEQEKAEAEKAERIAAAEQKEEGERTDEEKELLKEKAESQAKAREEEEAEFAESYAEKTGLTQEQAEKEAKKIYSLLDKYASPRDMAQAFYHLNTKFTQVSDELSAIKNQPKDGELYLKGKKLSQEEAHELLVSKYRESYPDLTEDMDDEKVYKLARKELNEKQRIFSENREKEIKDKAFQKRREILDNLPDDDKKFVKDVRGALYRADDLEVLSEDFDVMDYVYWARGKNYHKDMKAAVDKAVADALKDKKIIGSQAGATDKGSGAPAKKGGTVSLSDDEKERALEMYQSLQLPDDKKYELYKKFKDDITKSKKE